MRLSTSSEAQPWHILVGLFIYMMVFLGNGSVPAASLTVSVDSPGSVAFPDYLADTLWVSNTGAELDVYLSEDPAEYDRARYYFIPKNGESVQDIMLRFRLTGIPDSAGGVTPDDIDFWDGTLRSPTIVDSSIGMGGENYVEFTYPQVAVATFLFTADVEITFSARLLGKTTYAFYAFTMAEPYKFEDAGIDTGPLDKWFRLTKTIWPSEYESGGPLPDYIYTESVPASGETVEISGLDVVYHPDTITTDSDGVFGVAAFVDPNSFYLKKNKDGSVIQEAKRTGFGELRLRYEGLIRSKGIQGNFCEVIQAEGTIRLQGGSGTVSVGDLLFPGQRLSLGAGIGEKAQLGLRFVNGADANVTQDVFTNACIATYIEIGNNGFTDLSTIQSNTPLGSVAQRLCEEISGLPSTTEEWAKATGKLVATSAASSIITTGGIAGYAIKYGVETAAGEVYEHVVNKGGGSQKTAVISGAPERLDISTYYDGSSRISHNHPYPVIVKTLGSGSTVATIPAGQWQEIVGEESLGRSWSESPDTIDQSGPDIRFGTEYIAGSGTHILDVKAFDSAGIDKYTFFVRIDGSNNTNYFYEQGVNHWQGSLFSFTPASSTVYVEMEDSIGNLSSLTWTSALAPDAPEIDNIDPGIVGGTADVSWSAPPGTEEGDILFYEVRFSGSYISGPEWFSVGQQTENRLDLPSGVASDLPYYVEVRACDQEGRLGAIAKSDPLYAADVPDVKQVWIIH